MKRFFRSQGFKNLVVIAVVIFLGVLAAAFTHNASSPITSALGTVFSPLQKLSAAISENLNEVSVSFESASVYEEENKGFFVTDNSCAYYVYFGSYSAIL